MRQRLSDALGGASELTAGAQASEGDRTVEEFLPTSQVRIALPTRRVVIPEAQAPPPVVVPPVVAPPSPQPSVEAREAPPEDLEAPLEVPPRPPEFVDEDAETEEIAASGEPSLELPPMLDVSYELEDLDGGDEQTETMDIPSQGFNTLPTTDAAEDDEILGLPPPSLRLVEAAAAVPEPTDGDVIADLERLEQMLDAYLTDSDTPDPRCGMDEQWWDWFESLDSEVMETRFGLTGVWWRWFESMDGAA